jgi:hypothetical protein
MFVTLDGTSSPVYGEENNLNFVLTVAVYGGVWTSHVFDASLDFYIGSRFYVYAFDKNQASDSVLLR